MTSQDGPQVAGRRRPRRGLTAAAVLVAIVGLLVLGAGLGQLVWPARVTQQVVVGPPSADPKGDAGAAASALQFPHVIGLDAGTARAAIVAAGFRSVIFKTESRAAAGPESYVVGQRPEPYSQQAPALAEVTLILSQPSTMPDLVGKPAAEAQKAVTDLAGVPQVVRVTTADQPAGVVLGTDPAAGAPMPVNVTLRVSDGGDSLSLLALKSVASSRCDKAEDQMVNGQQHSQSLACTPGTDKDPAHVEYAIGRHATYLDATVGMLDTGALGSATIKVLGDGKLLATQEVQFGTATPLRVTVRDVLRLRIEVTGQAAAKQPRLVLGGVRLVGNPGDLDLIGG